MLTQEILKERFHYNPETGIFTYLVAVTLRVKIGQIAGCKSHQYLQIDGNPTNNRISNLRDATCLENKRNMRVPNHNTSGCTGIAFRKDKNSWRAQISVNNKFVHIGTFHSFEAAKKARKLAEKKYGFHENHGRQS